ncbi:PTS transporter subunit EIIC [Spiroplasma floricola]|uniref:PTS system, sucrose-specific IIABC component n=1 Tax=Spiroplasma floricola 23-6 TaxID=1336749 RepID=A0A2K8SDS9_9MOLU|nr:PTS transporter subunit EIIC [Spiroplasma floricola]AUB31583.1 PTS system, sucrose-specific IIABC component [Spiroplasma floricola 23-6]
MAKVNYAQEAKRFIDAVGGEENIESYLHCVTRLRFNVIDKEKVNIDEIKSSPIAKGTNWTQNQLQIILGTGVVEAAYAEVQKILEVKNNVESSSQSTKGESFEEFALKAKANKEALRNKGGRFAWLQMSMKTLGDIFLPIIPAIVAAGLAMGVAALIKTIVKSSAGDEAINPNSLLWIIIDIVTKTAFSSLSVLICWSTVKRFGGNPVIGIIIGLMLVSPLLPDKGAIASWDAQSQFLENYKINPIDPKLTGEQYWVDHLKLNLMTQEVKPIYLWIIPITGYQGSVLPALIIGIGVAYLEKWIKTWMPKSVNIIFTPFLTIVVALLVALLALGPVLLLVEKGVLIGTQAILNIPFGFGTALIAGVLQAIVITGCHQVLQGLEMQLVTNGSIPVDGVASGSIFNAIWTASIISQGGAAMAVALKTKSKQEKNLAMSSSVSTMFGITEPAIFGVNLPKIKPFIFASAGGAIGGFVAGLLNVKCSGMGVTVLPGLLLYTDSVRNLLLIILVNVVSFGSAFALSFFFYWEAGRKVTQKQIDAYATKVVNAQIDLKKFAKEVEVKNHEQKVKSFENKLEKMKVKEAKLKEDKVKYETYIQEVKVLKEQEKAEKTKVKLEKQQAKEELQKLKADPKKWEELLAKVKADKLVEKQKLKEEKAKNKITR